MKNIKIATHNVWMESKRLGLDYIFFLSNVILSMLSHQSHDIFNSLAYVAVDIYETFK